MCHNVWLFFHSLARQDQSLPADEALLCDIGMLEKGEHIHGFPSPSFDFAAKHSPLSNGITGL